MKNRLEQNILRQIKATGPIRLDEFMTICLQHPTDGYYTSRDPLSSRRDFVTAPEIGSLFGDIIGSWLAHQIQSCGFNNCQMVELGPGSGRLSQQINHALGQFCPQALQGYFLLETSPILRQIQHTRLPHAQHIADLSELPRDKTTLLVANEFLDALPLRAFAKQNQNYHEVFVTWDAVENLTWKPSRWPTPKRDVPIWAYGEPFVEHSPQAYQIVDHICQHIHETGGIALFIDYGTYGDRQQFSFRGFQNHEQVSFVHAPGETDLTWTIDFRMLEHVAKQYQLATVGPYPQGKFLREAGLNERKEKLADTFPHRRQALEQEMLMLAGQEHMGQSFKVFAVARLTR